MESAQLVKLVLTASVLLLVFGLGLRATFANATALLREMYRPPRRLPRAVFAMYVAVPLVAIVSLIGDGAVLAIASSMRHPGIALAIATLNVPEEPRMPAAMLLYVPVTTVATSVCGAVRRRQRVRVG